MNFDPVAPVYEFLSRLVFGHSLRKARWALLPEIPWSQRVLVVGGGTGELLAGWDKDRFPREIFFLEPSAKMLRQAQKRWQTLPHFQAQVHWLPLSVQELQAETLSEPLDALTTCFVLDLFPDEEIPALLDKLDRLLPSGAFWLFVDFQADRWWKQKIVGLMYGFFGITAGVKARKLPEVKSRLLARGYQIQSRCLFRRGLIEAVLFQKT
jgi:tRNA (cmo5U34)-methyltransferase